MPEVYLKLKLLTPMIGGGTDSAQKADLNMPFRSKSVKGNLIWWWRRVVAPACASSEELFKKEAELFGSAFEDTGKQSKVRVTVFDQQIPDQGRSIVELVGDDNSPIAYGYGMLREPNLKPKTFKALANIRNAKMLADASACVKLSFPDGSKEELLSALWLWLYLGGIGARTHRGFGALDWEASEPAPSLCELLLPYKGAKQASYLQNISSATAFVSKEYETVRKAWENAINPYREFRKRCTQGWGVDSLSTAPNPKDGRMPSPIWTKSIKSDTVGKYRALVLVLSGNPRRAPAVQVRQAQGATAKAGEGIPPELDVFRGEEAVMKFVDYMDSSDSNVDFKRL